MKELRFDGASGVWRIAFAFDPERKAILLTGGDKGGAEQKRFYKRLIDTADERYERHLAAIKAAAAGKTRKEGKHGKKS
jgi:hypothetical protein